jgi:hypothetical protein
MGSFRFGDARATRTWALLASHDGPARFTKVLQQEGTRHRARPVRYPGQRSTGVATNGATDAQEVDVPARDEQRIRNTHCSRITCNGRDCPGRVRNVDSVDGRTLGHTPGNRAGPVSIPAP